MGKLHGSPAILVWLSVIFSSDTIRGATDEELCDMCLKQNMQRTDHILCKFPDPMPAEKSGCHRVNMSITDDDFREKVLHWHNNYRNKFAEGSWPDQAGKRFPQAANMLLFHYDYQLERLARRNVQNCYYNHEPCRLVERFQYGQNLGYHAHSDPNGLPKDSEPTWEAWVGEMKHYDVRDVGKLGTGHHAGQVFHFVAATWANTRLVGCAQGLYETGSDINFRIEVACNYGPMGVWMGEAMYIQGEPCSQCPEGTTCSFDINYPNLCGGVKEEDFPYLDPVAGLGSILKIGVHIKLLLPLCFLIIQTHKCFY